MEIKKYAALIFNKYIFYKNCLCIRFLLLESNIAEGCSAAPTGFKGHNKMCIFQEEIFVPIFLLVNLKTLTKFPSFSIRNKKWTSLRVHFL